MTAQLAKRAPDRFGSVRAPFEADAELVALAEQAVSEGSARGRAAILTGDDDLILSGFPCLFFSGMRGKHRYSLHSTAELVSERNFVVENARREQMPGHAHSGKPDIIDIYAKHGWPAILVYSFLHRNDFAGTKGIADGRLRDAISKVESDCPLTIKSVIDVLSTRHGVAPDALVAAARVSCTHLTLQPTWCGPGRLGSPDLTYLSIWDGLLTPDVFETGNAFDGWEIEKLKRFASGEIEADGTPSPLWSCVAAVSIANAMVDYVLCQSQHRLEVHKQNSLTNGPLSEPYKLSVKQLTDMLRAHGERLTGDKSSLIRRLLAAAQRWQDRSAWGFVTGDVNLQIGEAAFKVAEKAAKRHLENAEPYAVFLTGANSGPLLLHDDVIHKHAGDFGADTLRQERRSTITVNDMEMNNNTGNLRIVSHPPLRNGLRNYVVAADVPPSMARQAPYTTLVALTSTAKNTVIAVQKCLCFGEDSGRQCRSFFMCVHARVLLTLVQKHMPATPGSTDGARQWALKPLPSTALSSLLAAAASVKCLGTEKTLLRSSFASYTPFTQGPSGFLWEESQQPFSTVFETGNVRASGRKRETHRAKHGLTLCGETVYDSIGPGEHRAAKTPHIADQQQ